MAENRRVLKFGDGSQKFADPKQYLPAGDNTPIDGTSLEPAIVRAVQVAVASAMSMAAAKSAATARTR